MFKYANGIGKTAPDASRKVDLRKITADTGLAVKTESCEEHLHLLAGSILRLIQKNECIIKITSSHECERRHFNKAFLIIPLEKLITE